MVKSSETMSRTYKYERSSVAVVFLFPSGVFRSFSKTALRPNQSPSPQSLLNSLVQEQSKMLQSLLKVAIFNSGSCPGWYERVIDSRSSLFFISKLQFV